MDKPLDEIDRKATKKAVEAALEKYRIYLLTLRLDQLPRVTQHYSLVPPSNTNKFHSSTEEMAIRNADYERERDEYIQRVTAAINRLSKWERAILIRRYMTEDDVYDYEVYNDLGMSERKYYRIKSRAFYKLAFALRIEVYKQ
ncbi:ArpU family phage packaging/lysis transcriptional regulator [Parageobacillus thermoglucosidasius]|uniref:ArpU family transcriptional regulator n=1 Tax=Parageobacillus thermoglucosidasius TaxID=1426 RepID=A0AAN0YP22_PARTM|nr:ArpU family phage packaging/lysis transcriptional regulator [Parageobacillus thermoglucosidasius]ALF09882.1 ArpU family transcriptional regulator [Parageobacillus thermoglucosidasius]ANZ29964.1 ArpU family transcriptional regulator [Parageobacillus thermoglucosidasius]APM80702.1 ArpU family transcriptional regulator [Parageobacillus thermoglucosidasius]KJX70296.1 ArpU family transcriptional regulator [Parageobacillus thermoglucosidasius]RDE21289.1 ArpU family transcriptional regulator [Para